MLKYFEWHSDPELYFFGLHKISPEDYVKVKNDASFSRLLYAVAFDNMLVQDRARRVERGIKSLIVDIKKELDL